jgi:LysR family tcuABC transcriptional regulator
MCEGIDKIDTWHREPLSRYPQRGFSKHHTKLIDIRQLRYFVRTYEVGNIKRAANDLSVVQSAVSHQLAKLEERLDVALFTRSSRGVAPTSAGQAFYVHATAILRQLEQAETAIRLQGGAGAGAGSVTMGLPPTTASAFGLAVLRAFTSTATGICINIVEAPEEALQKLLFARKIDFAVLFSANLPEDYDQAFLWKEKAYLLEANTKANGRHRKLTLEEATQRPLILPSRARSGFRRHLDKMLSSHGIVPTIVAEVDSGQVLLEAVATGIGASIRPWSSTLHSNSFTLNYTEIDNEILVRTAFLCSIPAALMSPAAKIARDLLHRELSKLISMKSTRPRR